MADPTKLKSPMPTTRDLLRDALCILHEIQRSRKAGIGAPHSHYVPQLSVGRVDALAQVIHLYLQGCRSPKQVVEAFDALLVETDAYDSVRDAILELTCTVCAMWAVYGDNTEFGTAMNRLTNAIFVHNQQLASPADIVDYCDQYVQAHERRIGTSVHEGYKGYHDVEQFYRDDAVDLADGNPE